MLRKEETVVGIDCLKREVAATNSEVSHKNDLQLATKTEAQMRIKSMSPKRKGRKDPAVGWKQT